MTLRLSVATTDLDASLKKAIGLAAGLEVPGVRLNTRTELDVMNVTESALRQTLLYVAERQMAVAGLLCPVRHALTDAEFLEPRLDVIRRSMSLCRRLQTSELIVPCGRIPDPTAVPIKAEPSQNVEDLANPFSFSTGNADEQQSDAAKFSLLTEILNDLAQHGNHVGCTLTLQLSGYNQSLIRQLLKTVNSGPLKIVFDPATAVMTGAPVTQTYRDLYDVTGYIRARDALRDVDGAGTEVAVKDGVVDWVELFPTLVDADFQGWICIERTGGERRKEDVSRGVSYLKTLIPGTSD